MNFYEFNYNNFHINHSNNAIPESGFYEVTQSGLLTRKKNTYDPKNRLALKHYIITGNDSYVELLASSYIINDISQQ